MSARVVTDVDAIGVERAPCSICRELERCAAPSGVDFRACAPCLLLMAELAAPLDDVAAATAPELATWSEVVMGP